MARNIPRMTLLAPLLALLLAAPLAAQDKVRARPPSDEIIYFVLPDRFANGDPSNDSGGIPGDRLRHGFDPTHKGFFNGGDLKGLTDRLDYIQGLGATAIWFAPIFKNKPVQGGPGTHSAGYHGYWVTDFTRVDPHFGTNAEFKAFVDAAHARGMKVYMDIIANHTADVIQYRECPTSACPYRSRADYPWTRLKGVNGAEINDGFMGETVRTAENFARLTRPDYAWTPVVPDAEKSVKVPAWLNDPIFYHNRGDTTFSGENSQMGDFVGLDDLFTDHPRVVQGMIDIYGRWIDEFGIDGFRVDTAKHVNSEFWQAFVPAMLARAKARGIPNFHIFGEVATGDYDPALLARYVQVDGYPAVLDFNLQLAVIAAAGRADMRLMERLPDDDALYGNAATPGWQVANQLPTFISNHDAGRFLMFARAANPRMTDGEALARATLAHAMLFLARGVPTVYYADEQGFAGLGNDQAARQTLFASKVPSYAAERLPGTGRTGAQDNFNPDAPLYRAIAALSKLRAGHAALRHGRQVARLSTTPGVTGFSRLMDGEPELLAVFNASAKPVTVNMESTPASLRWRSLAGACPASSNAPGSVTLTLPPFAFALCESVK
ncbi:alpha-amylase family glycosyl hydrolase [Sandaracinobacteroides saxicola]|uniref:Alpha-amylase n=1 Tax=Sandaracinobacteroides saxicola TaxID=2759707 RepID=A0A7G5IFP3_9SPHN|nr:alpha-amylase family glycosyl hydrolase [Sandaracinobacteroides saxicola]QMW22185.1 alpha-amylase [Sandaracinobacteroides saxicola]